MNNEITTKHQLITNTTAATAVQLVAMGTCELAVFVVGGGGEGHSSGGGSGFVELSTLRFAGLADLQATVGETDTKSVVSVEGKVEVEAGAGEKGSRAAGGSGYSGGGATGHPPGAGGAGGSDGQNSTMPMAGGKGSGLDIENSFLEDFVIT